MTLRVLDGWTWKTAGFRGSEPLSAASICLRKSWCPPRALLFHTRDVTSWGKKKRWTKAWLDLSTQALFTVLQLFCLSLFRNFLGPLSCFSHRSPHLFIYLFFNPNTGAAKGVKKFKQGASLVVVPFSFFLRPYSSPNLPSIREWSVSTCCATQRPS